MNFTQQEKTKKNTKQSGGLLISRSETWSFDLAIIKKKKKEEEERSIQVKILSMNSVDNICTFRSNFWLI